jgi:hypothetical protein
MGIKALDRKVLFLSNLSSRRIKYKVRIKQIKQRVVIDELRYRDKLMRKTLQFSTTKVRAKLPCD